MYQTINEPITPYFCKSKTLSLLILPPIIHIPYCKGLQAWLLFESPTIFFHIQVQSELSFGHRVIDEHPHI